MNEKAENPVVLLAGKNAPQWLQAYFAICQLKQLYRQGWLRRGVPEQRCESVAEHSFGVAVLSMLLSHALYPELDSCKAMRLALLHDFGEIFAGDIIPGDGVPAEEKRQLEYQSVERVFSELPGGAEYLALWQEFEHGASAEARFVRQVDRLEMGLQAAIYQLQGFPDLQQFFDSASASLSDPKLVELLQSAINLNAII